jgi:hypothetical protein
VVAHFVSNRLVPLSEGTFMGVELGPRCSGRQGRGLAGGSPAMSIARFGHVAIPQLEKATSRSLRGVYGPAALVQASGRRDPGAKQVWEPEHKRMTAASSLVPAQKSRRGGIPRAEPLLVGRRPMLSRLRTRALGEARRGMGPSAHTQTAEITSGSTIYQQGLAATCEDQAEERRAESSGGIWWGA